MSSFVTSRDGTRIAYQVAGSGETLILVDGAFCYRQFGPMGKLSAELAPTFRVISYDRRARGESGDTRPYAVEREIEDLATLIGASGGSACVYGISSGAALALAAAASGLPIRRLALYEPPFMVGPHARVPPADRLQVLQKMIAGDLRSDAVKYFMCDIIGMPRPMTWVMQFLPMWKKLKSVAPSLPYDCEVMGDFKVPEARARSINIPALVMHGGKTWPGLPDAARATAEAIPGARHQTLPGQTHNVAATAIGPVLRDFFKL
jgi:pimeloyl-ACP methyl ester carboxylesterase